MISIRTWMVCAAVSASAALAQPHHGDVELSVEDNRIVTGGHEGPTRVFASAFDATMPPSTIEPGFDCAAGTFPAGSLVGFRMLDALRAWDGSDFDAPADARLEIAFSTLSVLTPIEPQVVEGFSLSVNANGEWHRHLEFYLGAPAGEGVYLLSLQLHSNAGIADSLPFWVVFNQGEDEAVHDAAVDWARINLAGEGLSCDADVNCDFALDGFDVEAQERAVGGDVADYCLADPDFNGDQALDGFDVEAVEVAVGGGPCP